MKKKILIFSLLAVLAVGATILVKVALDSRTGGSQQAEKGNNYLVAIYRYLQSAVSNGNNFLIQKPSSGAMPKTASQNTSGTVIRIPVSSQKANFAEVKQGLKSFRTKKLPKDFVLNLSPLPVNRDLVVVETYNNKDLRPDLEKAKKNGISTTINNDLHFTFNSPDEPWTAAEKQAITNRINSVYPRMKQIAGPPLFDISVNIVKSSWLIEEGIFGMYNSSTNTIYLAPIPSLYLVVLTHEIGHAFQDDLIPYPDQFSESMTEALKIIVHSQINLATEPNLNFRLMTWYENLNKSQITPRNGSFHGFRPLASVRYMMGAYAWGKAYFEYPRLFKDMNLLFYGIGLTEPEILKDYNLLRQRVESLTPSLTLEGKHIPAWINGQYILRNDPQQGTTIYLSYGSFSYAGITFRGIAALAYVETFEGDVPIPNAPISLSCKKASNSQPLPNCNGRVLTTDENGFAYLLFNPSPVNDYAVVTGTYGGITDTTYAPLQTANGLFGILAPLQNGTLVALTPSGSYRAIVTNGTFAISQLRNYQGIINLNFNSGAIRQQVNKGKSDYYKKITP
ncbi:MAG: hypothetical protein Q8N16_03795 [bacterium]|nr:hypothetical protein [bacterium]